VTFYFLESIYFLWILCVRSYGIEDTIPNSELEMKRGKISLLSDSINEFA